MEEKSVKDLKGGSAPVSKKLKIVLPASATAKSKEECKCSLVVKIISEKNVGYGALLGTLSVIWKCKKRYAIISLGTNLYQIQFDLELDADKVLMGCPWYHDSHLMIIKKWRPGIENEEGAFNLASIWVQIWGLLLEWVSEAAGEEICEQLGTVLKKQVVFGGSKYGKFVRCLVEIDTSQPLLQGMLVSQDGIEKWINFKYENVSLYCAYCGIIGHKSSCCYAKVIDQNAGIYREETFGPELHGIPIKSVSESPLVPGKSQMPATRSPISVGLPPDFNDANNEQPYRRRESEGNSNTIPCPNPVVSGDGQQPENVREEVDKGKNKVLYYGESSYSQGEPSIMIVEETLSPQARKLLLSNGTRLKLMILFLPKILA